MHLLFSRRSGFHALTWIKVFRYGRINEYDERHHQQIDERALNHSAKIAPKQRGQFDWGKHRDRFAFDRNQFLLAKFGQRARKSFAHRAELRRQHALGHGQLDFRWRFAPRVRATFDQPVGEARFHVLERQIFKLAD